MAKDQEEIIVDVEEVYSKTEHWVVENQKSLTIIVGAIVLMMVSYLISSLFCPGYDLGGLVHFLH